ARFDGPAVRRVHLRPPARDLRCVAEVALQHRGALGSFHAADGSELQRPWRRELCGFDAGVQLRPFGRVVGYQSAHDVHGGLSEYVTDRLPYGDGHKCQADAAGDDARAALRGEFLGRLLGCSAARRLGYSATRLLGYSATRLLGYSATRLLGGTRGREPNRAPPQALA